MFFKLTQARNDAEVAELLKKEDCSDLLDHYTLEVDENLDQIERNAVTGVAAKVKVVSIIGTVIGDRIFDEEANAVIDSNGDVWITEQEFERVFC